MRAVFVLTALLVGASARSVSQDGGEAPEHCRHMPEFKAVSEQIGYLTADLVDFGRTLENAADRGLTMNNDIRQITTRLDKFKGSGCDDRAAFQCGGKKPRCVSRLLVCDGKPDCPSGADESQCRTFTPAGSKWHGTFSYDHCTKRRPGSFDLSIKSYSVVDHLKPFPEVSAHLDMSKALPDADLSVHLDVEGVMDLKPGNHILYFSPPEQDGLAMACTFDGVEDDHCHGQIIREGTGEVCAEFYLQRVDLTLKQR